MFTGVVPGDDPAFVHALIHLDAAFFQPLEQHIEEIDVVVAGLGAELVLEVLLDI